MRNVNSPSSGERDGYIAEIDALRALAVLSVVLCHLYADALPGGFTGVDIFFVISGYVVSRSLTMSAGMTFLQFVGGFYARRFARILPALVVCVVATGLLTVLFVPNSWLSDSIFLTGRYALFGFSNFALIRYDDGYFSPRSDYNPFTHTWSLAVEEQFYLIFPVLFYAFLKLRGRSDAFGIAAKGIVTALGTASLIYAWWLQRTDAQAAYYLLPTRFWELAAGAALLQCQMSGRLMPRAVWQAVTCIILGLVSIGLGFVYADPQSFPYPWALLPVAGTVLMIIGISVQALNVSLFHDAMNAGALRYVGRISYSLYLWHWPVFVLFRWTVGLDQWPLMVLAVALSFMLAAGSYHLVEHPIRVHARFLPWRRVSTIGIGVVAVLSALGLYDALFDHRGRLSLSVTTDVHEWYPDPYVSPSSYTGPKFTGHTIFAIGDSHLGAYQAMLQDTARDLDVAVRSYYVGACQTGRIYLALSQTEYCQTQTASILEEIEGAAKPGDIVFFPSLRAHRLVDQWAKFSVDVARYLNGNADFLKTMDRAVEENAAIIERLAPLKLQILLDAPKPHFMAVPFRCSDWFNAMNPICSDGMTMPRALLLELREPMMRELAKLRQRFDNVTIWDTYPVLCPTETCSAFDKDGPLFLDGDHLSGHGDKVLLPAFREIVSKLFDSASIPSTAVEPPKS